MNVLYHHSHAKSDNTLINYCHFIKVDSGLDNAGTDLDLLMANSEETTQPTITIDTGFC